MPQVARASLSPRASDGDPKACQLSNGHIAVRSSTHSCEGTILFTHAELNAWINNVKAGEFDGMTSEQR